MPRLSIFSIATRSRRFKLVRLMTVGVAAGRALQSNFVRRERTGLLRLRLRFGCGRFGGFAGMADIGTANGVHHMGAKIGYGTGRL